mmetsp:Transcript_73224/g.176998  ORF Transcript_73224/g.176998 Transcript_73224/m.176998 type:complete len:241 (-) Transcript_73224:516-1238(-)
MASSIMSLRFVMPISSTLLRDSTPSIFDSNWLTIESCTPVPSEDDPRDLQIASISSKMMMWSSESSPASSCSASASSNSFRMFSSDAPTYLFRISGPLTILGSRAFSALPMHLAINVLPQPGGPYNNIPRTWLMPMCFMISVGYTRLANARRKITLNSSSRPPTPKASKLKPFSNSRDPPPPPPEVEPVILILAPADFFTEIAVAPKNCPTVNSGGPPAPPAPSAPLLSDDPGPARSTSR